MFPTLFLVKGASLNIRMVVSPLCRGPGGLPPKHQLCEDNNVSRATSLLLRPAGGALLLIM